MALLNKLKSILGIGGSRDGDEQTATSVTVEREGSDRAETASDDSDTDDSASDEPVAAGTDAAASTGSMTDTDEPETETVTETAEASGPPTDPVDDEPVNRDVEDVIDEAEATDDSDEPEATDDTDEPEATETTDETDSEDDQSTAASDLTSIKGIGPAYSARLESAGVDSVAALAAADAEELSEQIDVSPKIISDWIDRAAAQ